MIRPSRDDGRPQLLAQKARAALNRGDEARGRKNWAAAAEAYDEVLGLEPTRADIWVQYGHALKERGLLAEAMAAYQRATRLNPNDGDAWEQLAHVRKALGDATGALQAFREVLLIDPQAIGAKEELIHAGARSAIPEIAYGQAAAAVESARLAWRLNAWLDDGRGLDMASSFPQGDHDSFRRQYPIQPPPIEEAGPLRIRISAQGATPAMVRATLFSLLDQRHQAWTGFVEASADLSGHSVGSLAHLDDRIRFNDPPSGHPDVPLVLLPAGAILDREALSWLDYALRRTGAAAVYCDHDHYTADWRTGPMRHTPRLQAMFDPYGIATSSAAPAVAIFRSAQETSDGTADALVAASRRGSVAHLPRLLVSLPDAQTRASDAPSSVALVYQPARLVVVIPTRDQHALLERSVATLFETASDPAQIAVTIIDNRSSSPETAAALARLSLAHGVRTVVLDEPFNWPRCNNLGVKDSEGDILVFANNDIEMLTSGWDDRIRHWLAKPDVGVVGARMIYPDGAIQHGGVLLGAWQGRPAHDGLWRSGPANGPLGRWRQTRAAAAVTGAFMACSRRTFDAVGGFDERFAIAYNDIDFCLKVREMGLKVIYAGEIELIHHESRTRGQNDSADKIAWDDGELADMFARWGDWLLHDPGYNPQWSGAVNRPYDAVRDLPLSRVLAHLDASARTEPWSVVRKVIG